MKKALITGISGQDGAYLSKLLLDKGYEVHGTKRRSSSENTWRMKELGIYDQIKFADMDLLEYNNIETVVETVQPDEFYNLGAMSFVKLSFDEPLYTSEVDAMGVLRVLEVIKKVNPEIKFYQASSSEMYGNVQEIPQNESTRLYPRSPYAVCKTFGHYMTINYRESYDLHASSGILFNHESPLRGLEFVTRKITHTLSKIKNGSNEVLELGNLTAKRDWGYAGDYVNAMWLMLQQDRPDDYVIATGEMHSVFDFVNKVAEILELKLEWEGKGLAQKAINSATNKQIIRVNPIHFRPTEVEQLMGDPTKAKDCLDWKLEVSFDQLVEMMVKADYDRVINNKHIF